MKNNNILNQAGMGLVEVLVSVAIMGIMGIGMMSMFDNQQKQIRYLLQKQDVIELRNILLRQLAVANVCKWQLKDKIFDTIDNPSKTVITLLNNTLYSGPDPASPALASAGQALPNTGQRTMVSGISFRELTPTLNANEYRGVFVINFNAGSLGLSLQPLTVQQYVTTETIPGTTQRRILSCSVDPAAPAASGPKGIAFTSSSTFTAPLTGTYKVTVIGGGGGGGGGLNQASIVNGAGGGGAGGTAVAWVNLSETNTYPVEVGVGGNGTAADGSGNNGMGGTRSSFQGVWANGGQGGFGSSGQGFGGPGGASGGGMMNVTGGFGASGGRGENAPTPPPGFSWYSSQGGSGGTSSIGGGGSGGVGGSGANGSAYGSGGGGGDGQNASGGNGANGVVIIEWAQ